MHLIAVPALHYSCEQLAAIVGDCFEGYSVPFSLPPAVFAQRFIAEGLSLVDSCVWLANETPAAVALITRRGVSARLAAFAIRPAYRAKGQGKRLLAPLMAALRERGVVNMQLEVIQENHPAVTLYRNLGFVMTQELYGFQGAADASVQSVALQALDPLEVVRKATGESNAMLSWLVDPLSSVSLPALAFEYRKHAYAVLATHMEKPQLRFIYVEPEYRRKGFASELLRALNQRFPGLSTSVVVPARFTPLFTRAGYLLMPISQYEMKADL